MVLSRRTRALLVIGLCVAGAAMAAELIDVGGGGGKGDWDPKDPPVIVTPLNPGGGPDGTYADEGGDTPEAPTADEGDEAPEGTYADEGGTAPTAPYADEGGEALDTPTADTADDADEAGTAATTDLATDVVECGGGPWLDGACGDLRTDGNVGINTTAAHALDVAGDVLFDTLQVDALGAVGVRGTPEDGAALRVHGTLRARGVRVDGPRPVQRTTVTGDSCVHVDGYGAAAHAGDGSVSADFHQTYLHCPIPVPADSEIVRWECDKESTEVSWRRRYWDDTSRNPAYVDRLWVREYASDEEGWRPSWWIDPDEVHFLRVGLRPGHSEPVAVFRSCTFEWVRW